MPTPTSQANWGKILDDTVDELFYQDLKQTVSMYNKIFNVSTMDSAQFKQLTGVGFEDWRLSGEAKAATFTSNIQGLSKTYVPSVWKNGFVATRELKDDARFSEVSDGARELARTAIRTLDKEAAKMLNNDTNTTYFTGADALALAVSNHTREDGGTALSNVNTSGPLNETNFETAKVAFMERLDGRGELIDMEPDTLLVPPALEKEAKILMGSTGRPSTGDNDINVYNGALTVMVWKRLGAAGGGSDTAWRMLDSTYNKSGKGLNIFMRVNPEINREVELETGVTKFVGYMRFAEGFTDWRGYEKSAGTA